MISSPIRNSTSTQQVFLFSPSTEKFFMMEEQSQPNENNFNNVHKLKNFTPVPLNYSQDTLENTEQKKGMSQSKQNSEKNMQTTLDIIDDLLNTQSKRLQTKKRAKKIEDKKSVKRVIDFRDYKQSDKFQKRSKEITYQNDDEEDQSDLSSNGALSKRVRKNRDQIKALQQAFHQTGGNWSKNEQKMLARELGLNEQQVYKWCWDQGQKRRKLSDQTAQQKHFESKPQCTDEFGGYSKSWLNKNMTSASQNCFNDDSYAIESISQLVGIDIEQKAKAIVSKKSPEQRRQIAKPVNTDISIESKVTKIASQSFTLPLKQVVLFPQQQSSIDQLVPQSPQMICSESINKSSSETEMTDIRTDYNNKMSDFQLQQKRYLSSSCQSLNQSPLSLHSKKSQVSFGTAQDSQQNHQISALGLISQQFLQISRPQHQQSTSLFGQPINQAQLNSAFNEMICSCVNENENDQLPAQTLLKLQKQGSNNNNNNIKNINSQLSPINYLVLINTDNKQFTPKQQTPMSAFGQALPFQASGFIFGPSPQVQKQFVPPSVVLKKNQ